MYLIMLIPNILVFIYDIFINIVEFISDELHLNLMVKCSLLYLKTGMTTKELKSDFIE